MVEVDEVSGHILDDEFHNFVSISLCWINVRNKTFSLRSMY